LEQKRQRALKNEEIESCLYEWFLERRQQQVTVSEPILFAKLLNVKDFKPNND
jgi:hypothetical protein